jgi:C-terminal processing protease CtpA/Prc
MRNTIYNRILYPLTLIILILTVASCERFRNKPDLPEDILILNHWIWTGMNAYYLWEQHIPDLDPDYEEDPEAYFYKLLFADDRDSWIVDNYEELRAMFDGVEMATGVSARPGLLEEDQVISIVEYVTPNSPAADSGIARGDIIIAIDGQTLNRDNYYNLYYQNTASLEFGDWNGNTVVPNGRKVTLTAKVLNQNPVIHSEVIDYEGAKIGYFTYVQFTDGQTDEWLDEINRVFDDFLAAGVTEVVVDLRYNRGGSLDLSGYIASTLGPASAMQNEDVYVRLVWNEYYNDYWRKYDWDDDGEPDGEDSPQLMIRLPVSERNLNLSRVYFLTTDLTASASESLMTGLYPYAQVIQVGDTTYGKCYGSITISDFADPKRHSWAMQPLVLKYANASGFTDFVNGLIPDFPIEENLLYAQPFGSPADPLLAIALEDITGVAPAKKGARVAEERFQALPVPRKPIMERNLEWSEEILEVLRKTDMDQR